MEVPGPLSVWFGHLFTNASLYLFASLQEQFQIPNLEIFRYLQINNFFSTYIRDQTNLQSQTFLEHMCSTDPRVPGLILKYMPTWSPHQTQHHQPISLAGLLTLIVQLEPEDWSDIWNSTELSMVNILALETNYKVLTRWYLLLARIAKVLPTYSLNCFRGCVEIGTHMHVWWTCPVL